MNGERESRLAQLFAEMPEILRDRYRENGEGAIENLRPMMNVLLDRRLRPFRTDEQIENALGICSNDAISHMGYLAFCRSEILEGNLDPLGAMSQLMLNDKNHQFGKFWLSSLHRPEIMGILVETIRSEMRSIANGELERRRVAAMGPEERRAYEDEQLASYERFDQFRLQTFLNEARTLPKGSLRHNLALEALRAMAVSGHETAQFYLRGLIP